MAIDMEGGETKDVASCPLFPFTSPRKNTYIPRSSKFTMFNLISWHEFPLGKWIFLTLSPSRKVARGNTCLSYQHNWWNRGWNRLSCFAHNRKHGHGGHQWRCTWCCFQDNVNDDVMVVAILIGKNTTFKVVGNICPPSWPNGFENHLHCKCMDLGAFKTI